MFNINPYEGANIFDAPFFVKDAIMDGEEIAAEFGTTRQNVSRILKDALAKFYLKVKILNKEMTPFEIATCMMEMLGVTFTGLRNQNRLYLPDDWPEGIYPLRKDFDPAIPVPHV